MREVRFAVGSKGGWRSALWKCAVHGDEIYVMAGLFGGLAKISLHSTGECRWSCTDDWVRQDANRKNADRLIAKWNVVYPDGDAARLALRIAVPMSELRMLTATEKKAFWIGGAPPKSTVEFCFYVTRPTDDEPATDGNHELRHLASLQLRSKRWVVIFFRAISLSAADIASARDNAIAQARAAGVHVSDQHRLALYAPMTVDTSAAFLEVGGQ